MADKHLPIWRERERERVRDQLTVVINLIIILSYRLFVVMSKQTDTFQRVIRQMIDRMKNLFANGSAAFNQLSFVASCLLPRNHYDSVFAHTSSE